MTDQCVWQVTCFPYGSAPRSPSLHQLRQAEGGRRDYVCVLEEGELLYLMTLPG